MKSAMKLSGCYTALLTPMDKNERIDTDGYEKNIKFQISQGVTGVVPAGTTGGSPTLTPPQHIYVNQFTSKVVSGQIEVLAGTGSNSVEEALYYTRNAVKDRCKGVLMVDCYYNAPSSLELRGKYYAEIAKRFPDTVVIPYIIPGRTGTELSVPDLAWLAWTYPNVCGVKDASGNVDRMNLTRSLTSERFSILSGDDDMTSSIMLMPAIKANGVISVIANACPLGVQQMCDAALRGDVTETERLHKALSPLFSVVTVKAKREVVIPSLKPVTTEVWDKFRNPDAINTIMNGLGMPAGPCRAPLGKMTPAGVQIVRNALRAVWANNPELLRPVEEFYKVDVAKRLADNDLWASLTYSG